MVPAFAAPGVYSVIYGIFVDGLEFPGHHGLMHKNLVPGHPVPLVVPGKKSTQTNKKKIFLCIFMSASNEIHSRKVVYKTQRKKT
jgi:hypothetical protein